MRDAYLESLSELSHNVDGLADRLKEAVSQTSAALSTLDRHLARDIYNGDDEIDELVRQIMQQDLSIGIMQSPVASDWRSLMSTFKILSDIERIADHCADISEYILRLAAEPVPVPPPAGIGDMYQTMASMVTESLRCYKENDDSGAELLRDRDDIVDAAFTTLTTALSEKMARDPSHIHSYIAYVLILKYIERMADHAANIANWVLYKKRNQIK